MLPNYIPTYCNCKYPDVHYGCGGDDSDAPKTVTPVNSGCTRIHISVKLASFDTLFLKLGRICKKFPAHSIPIILLFGTYISKYQMICI